jgi:hypothetical protein
LGSWRGRGAPVGVGCRGGTMRPAQRVWQNPVDAALSRPGRGGRAGGGDRTGCVAPAGARQSAIHVLATRRGASHRLSRPYGWPGIGGCVAPVGCRGGTMRPARRVSPNRVAAALSRPSRGGRAGRNGRAGGGDRTGCVAPAGARQPAIHVLAIRRGASRRLSRPYVLYPVLFVKTHHASGAMENLLNLCHLWLLSV